MLNIDVMNLIGALALKLHTEESAELNAQLTDVPHWLETAQTEDYKIEGNTVCFSSRAARNRVLAAFLFGKQEKELANDDERWILFAYDLWRHEIGQEDSAAGRLLAIVHENTDVTTIVANAINNKTIEVFSALNTLQAALPYLKRFHTEGILRLSEAQHELTKRDLAAGVFFGGLGKTLIGYPEVCRDLHDRLSSDITEAVANLYPTVLVALANSSPRETVKLALTDAESPNDLLRSMALWTLGRLIALSFVDSESGPAACDEIISNMSHSTENVRKAAILAAAGATPKTDAFVDELSKFGELADQLSLEAIAHAVRANFDEIRTTPYFPSWLKYLCRVPAATKGLLDQFDHVLSRLVSDAAYQDLVFSCLAEWVILNGKGGPHDDSIPECFQMSTVELAKHPIILSQLITQWLLADERRLASAAGGLLRYLHIRGLEKPKLSIEILDTLQPRDLLLLARRLLGFVFSDGHLLSLSMSFLEIKDAPNRAFPILHALLVDEIGYDYPGSTIETLEAADAIEERSEFKSFYSHTIQALKRRMQALAELPRLTELQPPTTLQRQFSKARAKQINRAMLAERKKSILRQIVTEVPIKAGIGWFSFRDGAYTEPSYLKSISHSVELPRRSTLDTVGAELRLWSMSQATRDES